MKRTYIKKFLYTLHTYYRRQENVQLIARSLNMGDLHSDIADITHQFHHIFWFGDLNYRLDMSIPVLCDIDYSCCYLYYLYLHFLNG